MSIKNNSGINHRVVSKSSLTILDGLIIHHRCKGTTSCEDAAYFTFGKYLPSWIQDPEVCRLLSITKVNVRLYKIEGPSVMHALYFLRSLLEIFGDCMPKFFNLPLGDQLQVFNLIRTWPIADVIDNIKYFTCYPFARYIHQTEMPQMPSSYRDASGHCLHPLLWTGRVRRMLKNRLVAMNKSNTRLFGSILLGCKRGCYTVPKEFIEKSYEKHRKTLSTPPEQDEHNLLSFLPYIDRLLYKVRPIKNYRLFDASTSASFEYKANEGGQREYVRDWLAGNPDGRLQIHTDILDTMYLGRDYKIHEMRTVDLSDAIDRACTQYKNSPPLKVMVHGLTEPLKVRLITKGEAVPYWISHHFQKSMWDYLQNYAQFSPTGTPLSVSDLNRLQKRKLRLESRTGLKFDKWVSGDYSAATDGVNLHMTMMVFYSFASRFRISEQLTELLSKVIGPQMIHYPLKDEDGNPKIEPFLQQNGQLMGSTLSFPILCAINIMAYWKALESFTGKVIKLEDLPVIVNGDDILFPASDDFYSVWKETVKEVGFKLSLGKNYISDKLLTINSMIFNYDRGQGTFTYEPFYNSGLVTGVSKHGGRTNDRIKPIWDIYNQFIEGCYDPIRGHRRFLHYYKDIIKKMTGNGLFNLFITWDNGGFGFRNPALLDWSLTKSKKQRRTYRKKYGSYVRNCDRIRITNFQRRFGLYCQRQAAESLERNNKISKLGIVEYNTDPVEIVPKLQGVHSFIKCPSSRKLPRNLFLPLKEAIPKISPSALTYGYDFIKQPLFKVVGWKTIRKMLKASRKFSENMDAIAMTTTEGRGPINEVYQSVANYLMSLAYKDKQDVRLSNRFLLNSDDSTWYVITNEPEARRFLSLQWGSKV